MFEFVFTQEFAVFWILLCLLLYGIFYFYEIVDDLPISGQSPCTAHATLKLLIQKFIEEAAGLPKLKKLDDHPAVPDDTNNRTYEDLLSTAVINKVIQNYQEAGVPSSSGSVSSRASTSSRKRCEKEYFFGERSLRNKPHEDTSSVSSLDEWVRDSAQGSTKYFDKKSLTIRQHLGEISSTEDEVKDEEDEAPQSLTLPIRDNDWQENWHLRRRKVTGSLSPAPMLVPNPISSAKVLIGDRDAEDTSDLSDGASEFEEVLEPTSINAVLVNSKSLIGGRNPIESLMAKAESISDEGSTDDSDLAEEREDIVQKFSSLESRDEVIAQVANESLISQHDIDYYDFDKEQDSEYTEKYATLPRTIVKCPQPAPRQCRASDTKSSYLLDDSKLDNGDSGVTSEEDERQKSVNGDYRFSRGSKSGYHSEENSKNFTSSFERDSSRLDGLSRLDKMKSEEISFEKLRSEVSRVPERPEALPESPIQPEAQVVFRALPVLVKEDFSDIDSSLEPTTPTFSSGAESIERTYNLQTGNIINRRSESLEGLRFSQKSFDENENVLEAKTSTPIANHMRLVEEIANENPEIYAEIALISPPGDFKGVNGEGFDAKNSFSQEEFSLRNEDLSLEENLHPVQSVLKKLSQSFPELTKKAGTAFPKQQLHFDDSENEVEIQDAGVTVNSIKERFEAVSSGKQEVYSLTARSIPKQFRQELKKEVVKDPEEIPANKSPTGENMVPFPKAKTKIEFFEKFSQI